MIVKNVISVLCLSLAFLNVQGQLTVTGNDWTPTMDANAITEAGLDYSSTYNLVSLTNQSEMDVVPLLSGLLPPLFNWTVQASITSTVSWHTDLKLSVKRNPGGTGTSLLNPIGIPLVSPQINGGTNFQELSLVPTTFFTGRAIYHDIPLQYRISGLSVLIPTKTYSVDVLYTFIGL